MGLMHPWKSRDVACRMRAVNGNYGWFYGCYGDKKWQKTINTMSPPGASTAVFYCYPKVS